MCCLISFGERKVKSLYEDLNETLVKPFLRVLSPSQKRNRDGLMGSCVCTTTAMNLIISDKELSRYNLYVNQVYHS